MSFSSLPISKKVGLSSLLMIVFLCLMALVAVLKINEMRHMQDEGHVQSNVALELAHHSETVVALYRVMADAQINGWNADVEKQWKEALGKIDAALVSIEKTLSRPQEKDRLLTIKTSVANMKSLFEEKMVPALKAGGISNETRTLDSDIDGHLNRAMAAIREAQQEADKAAVEADASFDSSASSILNLIMTLAVVVILIAIASGYLIGRSASNAVRQTLNEFKKIEDAVHQGDLHLRGKSESMHPEFRPFIDGLNRIIDETTNPIAESMTVVERMSVGDFSSRVKGDYKGDHALMKESVNRTIASMNEVLEQVRTAVEQVKSGSGQVASASQSLSQGAMEQASSLEEITSSMAEIGSQTNKNAESASEAKGLSDESRRNADQGNAQMKKMLEAMSEINVSSEKISKIIKVIDEIAFQTNLLALNAAVEAARAGKHGKGFAVVAEEVRNLAARSATAAKETTEMIEESGKKVSGGMSIAHETAKALDEILSSTSKVSGLVRDIAEASNAQAQGVSQIVTALGQIDQVTQRNTASAEESAAASEELSGQSSELSSMIMRFQLEGQNTGSRDENELIHWSPSYHVGVKMVDTQHRRLVDIINKLHSAIRSGRGKEVLSGILDELIDYTKTHFHDEEQLQLKSQYPDFPNHKKIHEGFVEKIRQTIDEYKSGATTDAAAVVMFLKDWLVSHIQKTDTKYVPFVKNHFPDL